MEVLLGLQQPAHQDKEYFWISDEDVELGLEFYSYLHYCQSHVVEAAQLSVFFDWLLSNQSLKTVVASTMNNIQPRVGDNLQDLTAMDMWFEELDKKLNVSVSLGPLLFGLSSTTQLMRLEELDPPYLRMFTTAIKVCLYENDCQGLLKVTGNMKTNYSKLISLTDR